MLAALLDKELGYEVYLRNGFSTHLPMALIALDRLGAGPDRLDDFFTRNTPRLVPLGAPQLAITPATWRENMGTGTRYADLRAYFDRQLAYSGVDAVVRGHLGDLVPKLADDLFHCEIRLAYALEAGHDGQIAAALAYFADARHRPTAERTPARTAALLDDVAAASLRSYLAHRDLYSLHTVTGAQALRVLLPWLDDDHRRDALETFAGAVASLHTLVGGGASSAADGEHSAAPGWPEVIARALASDDTHVIKLTFSCRLEEQRTGDVAYRYAASTQWGAPR